MISVAIDCRTFRIPTNFQDCTVVKIDTKPPLFYIQGYGAFIIMITKDIARLIYNCYSEIESGEKMIEELKARLNENGELELKDNWGNSKGLELRIPNDGGSYSIKQVPFHLALDVIVEHIENQKKELSRLKDVCRVQLH